MNWYRAHSTIVKELSCPQKTKCLPATNFLPNLHFPIMEIRDFTPASKERHLVRQLWVINKETVQLEKNK